MRTGLGFPSYQRLFAAITAVSGGWGANYPLANVGDIFRVQPPARASSTSSRTITWTISGGIQPVQFFAIIGHNLAAVDTFRLRLFNDTNPDPVGNVAGQVYDSGVLSFWPSGGPVAGYTSIRPHILANSVNARSAHLLIANNSVVMMEIAALELAAWWELPGIGWSREFGVEDSGSSESYAGGAEAPPDSVTPRVMNGQVDRYAISALTAKGLDFQRAMGQHRPFVWVQDADDAATWPRGCMLARNRSLPMMVGALYRHDIFPLRLVEHLR